jgi:SAM-dependent methyltransferase
MSDPATIAFYQREAPNYTASGAQGQARHLDAFLDLLAPGAVILELGCGGGKDASHMRDRGFSVDPTDGTPSMVLKAQERFGLPARLMQFDELDAVEAYDAVWTHASLLHCPRADLPQVLAQIRRALRPGGWHYANYKLGNSESRDSFGRLYNFPERDWLYDRYGDVGGWAIVDAKSYIGGGFDKVQRNWIALTVRKDA